MNVQDQKVMGRMIAPAKLTLWAPVLVSLALSVVFLGCWGAVVSARCLLAL